MTSSGPEDVELLYHCFPSQFGAFSKLSGKSRSDRVLETGLAILKSTLSYGLLLTPEKVAVELSPESKAAARGDSRANFEQTRACFALMSLEDLTRQNQYAPERQSHLDVFGEFAIGLEPGAARALDMAPVQYAYARDLDGRYSMIASLQAALVESRELLSALALLERKVWQHRETMTPEMRSYYQAFAKARINLMYASKEEKGKLEEARERADVQSIETVLDCLATDRRKLGYLVAAFDLLTGLIQSVDSQSLQAPLLYFSQREWRLTQVMNETLVGFNLGAPDEGEHPLVDGLRRKKLEDVRRIARLTEKTITKEWLADCFVVSGTTIGRRHFREFIQVLICPNEAVDQVAELCNDFEWGNNGNPSIVSSSSKHGRRSFQVRESTKPKKGKRWTSRSRTH